MRFGPTPLWEETPSPRRSGDLLLTGLIGFGIASTISIVILVQLSAVIAGVPVTISGSLHAPGNCGYGCILGSSSFHLSQSEQLPAGPSVQLTWVEASGALVWVELFGPINGTTGHVCLWEASHGSCSFVSQGGNYTIQFQEASGQFIPSMYRINFTIEYQQSWM